MAGHIMTASERMRGLHLMRSVDALQLLRFVLEQPDVANERDRADALAGLVLLERESTSAFETFKAQHGIRQA